MTTTGTPAPIFIVLDPTRRPKQNSSMAPVRLAGQDGRGPGRAFHAERRLHLGQVESKMRNGIPTSAKSSMSIPNAANRFAPTLPVGEEPSSVRRCSCASARARAASRRSRAPAYALAASHRCRLLRRWRVVFAMIGS